MKKNYQVLSIFLPQQCHTNTWGHTVSAPMSYKYLGTCCQCPNVIQTLNTWGQAVSALNVIQTPNTWGQAVSTPMSYTHQNLGNILSVPQCRTNTKHLGTCCQCSYSPLPDGTPGRWCGQHCTWLPSFLSPASERSLVITSTAWVTRSYLNHQPQLKRP